MDASTTTLLLPASQAPQAAAVLARAFQQDPLYAFAVPDEARRAWLLPRHLVRIIRYGLLCGRVYTTPGLDGVAVWLNPESGGSRLRQAWGLLKSGLWLSAFHFRWQELWRLLAFALVCEEMQHNNTREPHWYLLMLGVDPVKQGQGLGHRLLQPVLQEAENRGLSCYLDTTLEQNLVFYARYNFEQVAEGQVGKDGPHCWAMQRLPVTSSRKPV